MNIPVRNFPTNREYIEKKIFLHSYNSHKVWWKFYFVSGGSIFVKLSHITEEDVQNCIKSFGNKRSVFVYRIYNNGQLANCLITERKIYVN